MLYDEIKNKIIFKTSEDIWTNIHPFLEFDELLILYLN